MISFITLTWNSEKYIDACIESIVEKCQEESLLFEVIVVDNGSTDFTRNKIERYKKKYPKNIKSIYLGKNRGTTYTRNIALKKSKGAYISIIDSDTRILKGSFSNILKYLDNHPTVGIVAPKLILPNGEIQHSVKKFPSFLEKLKKIQKIFGDNAIVDSDFYTNFPFAEVTDVETAISACWIFKKSLLSSVGFLDEHIFYSPEDLDFCLRVWKSGRTICYYPELKLLHNTQQITHKNPFGKIALTHLAGLFYYYKKHGGWITTRSLNFNTGQGQGR